MPRLSSDEKACFKFSIVYVVVIPLTIAFVFALISLAIILIGGIRNGVLIGSPPEPTLTSSQLTAGTEWRTAQAATWIADDATATAQAELKTARAATPIGDRTWLTSEALTRVAPTSLPW